MVDYITLKYNITVCIQTTCLHNILRNTFNTSSFPNNSEIHMRESEVIPAPSSCTSQQIPHSRCYTLPFQTPEGQSLSLQPQFLPSQPTHLSYQSSCRGQKKVQSIQMGEPRIVWSVYSEISVLLDSEKSNVNCW